MRSKRQRRRREQSRHVAMAQYRRSAQAKMSSRTLCRLIRSRRSPVTDASAASAAGIPVRIVGIEDPDDIWRYQPRKARRSRMKTVNEQISRPTSRYLEDRQLKSRAAGDRASPALGRKAAMSARAWEHGELKMRMRLVRRQVIVRHRHRRQHYWLQPDTAATGGDRGGRHRASRESAPSHSR